MTGMRCSELLKNPRGTNQEVIMGFVLMRMSLAVFVTIIGVGLSAGLAEAQSQGPDFGERVLLHDWMEPTGDWESYERHVGAYVHVIALSNHLERAEVAGFEVKMAGERQWWPVDVLNGSWRKGESRFESFGGALIETIRFEVRQSQAGADDVKNGDDEKRPSPRGVLGIEVIGLDQDTGGKAYEPEESRSEFQSHRRVDPEWEEDGGYYESERITIF